MLRSRFKLMQPKLRPHASKQEDRIFCGERDATLRPQHQTSRPRTMTLFELAARTPSQTLWSN
ncbi:hypothetical protein RHGRI_029485 [Rhododendron griersonianum]|uniref:Uncharacterized protein n=1 Tax=Rhododendron griersonianum TaxID=479676 RepID=A0AAV6IJM0_9ERIC|nr:hypothetical protein RHGRI_029485 [Rhododendron griersonianum]